MALNPACDVAGYALAPASVIAPVTGMDPPPLPSRFHRPTRSLKKRSKAPFPHKALFSGILETALYRVLLLSEFFGGQRPVAKKGAGGGGSRHSLQDIVWNTLIAPCSLGETLTPRRLFSAAIIFFTATTSAWAPICF